MGNNLNDLPKPEINQVDTFGFDASDTITGFEGCFTTPMRKQSVKRYTVNHKPKDWNERQEIAKCINPNINLNDYKIIRDSIGLKVDFLTWKHFDWADLLTEQTHPITKQVIYTFVAYRDERSTVLKCIKLI